MDTSVKRRFNKSLHLTAIPLRSIAAGGFGRYGGGCARRRTALPALAGGAGE